VKLGFQFFDLVQFFAGAFEVVANAAERLINEFAPLD